MDNEVEDFVKIPLLHDHHNHLALYSAMNDCLNLDKITDYNEAIALISKTREKVNIVIGWKFTEYNIEDIEELPAVLICNSTLHSFIMNEKAKIILRNDYPEIVKNIGDTVWVEKNLPEILKFIPKIKKISLDDIKSFFEFLEENYIYSLDEMLTPSDDFIDLVEEAGYSGRCNFWMDIKTYMKIPHSYRDKIAGIKIFLDGAAGTETAAIDGYLSGKCGIKIYSKEKLKETLEYIERENKPVAVHVIGNSAIADFIDVLENNKIDLPMIRLEHATYITKKQAVACKQLGIKLCMQPNFSEDAVLFKSRIKEEVLNNNNNFRMLIDEVGFRPGIDFLLGSDGMPHGAETALRASLFPVYESQKLSLDEFVKAYCVNTEAHGTVLFSLNNKDGIEFK